MQSHRIVEEACFTAAVLLVVLAVASVAGCTRPMPARSDAERGRYWREVSYIPAGGGEPRTCMAQLPLVVRFEKAVADLAPDVYAADAVWSEVLGYPVMVPARETELHTLFVTVDAAPVDKPHRLAEVVGWCEGGVFRQTMTFFVTGDSIANYYVAMHELGHALAAESNCDSMGHSCNPKSIMFKQIVRPDILSDDEDDWISPQWVRDDDKAALRRAWTRTR